MKRKTLSLGALFLAYFLCYVIKISPSVVMMKIQEEIVLSSTAVSLISGMYFLPYALIQFFVGPLCRRFGAEKVVGTGLVISALGLLVFGSGHSFLPLALGRFLLGVGTAPFFIGMCFFLGENYSGRDYVRVYGYGIFISNFGSACASAPLKAAMNLYGILPVFLVLSTLSVLLAAVLFCVGGKRPEGEKGSREDLGILKGMALTFSRPVLRAGLLLWFVQCWFLMSYQGLWCVRWTAEAFPDQAGLASLSGIAIALGCMLAGLYGKYLGKGKSISCLYWESGVLEVAALLLVIVCRLLGDSRLVLGLALLSDVLFGFAGSYVVLRGGAFINASAPEGENARILGIYNGLGCLVQQLSQWSTGIALDVLCLTLVPRNAFAVMYGVIDLFVLLQVVLLCPGLTGKKSTAA